MSLTAISINFDGAAINLQSTQPIVLETKSRVYSLTPTATIVRGIKVALIAMRLDANVWGGQNEKQLHPEEVKQGCSSKDP